MTRDCGRELAVTPAFTEYVLLALLVICSLGQACSADSRSSEKQTVPQWSISFTPTLVIGTEGDPHYEFFRIVDVATLPNGALVVAEGGNQELRVYSGAGEFLRTFGGSGDGPGEFRNLARVAARGDTILAFGQAFRAPARLRVFHAEQGLLWGATVRPENESGAVTPANILSSRALLVIRGGWRAATAPPEGTVVRDTLTLGILESSERESQTVNWLGEFPNQSWFSYEVEQGGAARRIMGRYTLGASLVTGASGGRIWLGDTDTGVITIFDDAGSVVSQFELPQPPRAFDEAALEDARTAALARVGDPDVAGERSRINTLYSSGLRPTAAPRFTRFTAGPDGEMWVECFTEIDGAEHCAVVLDPAGHEIGRATIPAGLDLRAVDHDRVIGVITDANGVERVAIHSLDRS
jgi:hypothetical protein